MREGCELIFRYVESEPSEMRELLAISRPLTHCPESLGTGSCQKLQWCKSSKPPS